MIEPWQRLNAELKFKLTELRASYGPQHPAVRQQEARVSAASLPPPELLDLKQQEQALLASIASFVGEASEATSSRSLGIGPRVPGAGLRLESDSEDPELDATRVRLNAALDKARDVRDRLDAARMEMATASVSFKYRYAVVESAEVSRKPTKPKRELLYGIAVGVALLLGMLVGAARELMTGRLVEPWQVRSLGLDILAEVNLQEPPRRG